LCSSDGLQAEKASLEHALAAARAERTRMEGELDAMRRRAAKTADEMRVENAELRRRIDEVAEDILRVANADRQGAANEPRSAAAE
jgi:chromosome segregation ATPase